MKKRVVTGSICLVVLVGCGEDSDPVDAGFNPFPDTGVEDGGGLPDSSPVDATPGDSAVSEGGGFDGGEGDASDAASDSTVVDAGPQPEELECPTPVMYVNECPVCDADATCDSASYTDLGDGTVASSCCGLVWQQVLDGVLRDFGSAHAYCESLTLAGGGWRLPTITELQTLVEGTTGPTINETFFPDTPADNFWSSTAYEFSGRAWNVIFYDGSSGGTRLEDESYVRCVR